MKGTVDKKPTFKEIYEYYSQEEILKEMLRICKDREISTRLRDGSFTKRPNTIQYPRDVLELVRQGSVSFHGSVERWNNPMRIGTGMAPDELSEIRKGWDLIIDIDSMLGMEAAKITASKIIDFLHKYGIKSISLKFSGNRGFHICLPFEIFPAKIDFEDSRKQFPRIPRILASFIRNRIKDELLQSLIKMKGSMRALTEELDKYMEELSPYNFVEVEKDWGERHLFRLPYSFNEKSWLISTPIKIKDLDEFKKEDALPQKVKVEKNFLGSSGEKEATEFVVDAIDWFSRQKTYFEPQNKRKIRIKKFIPEKRFPPCIKLILGGLSDGRKRGLFILINFLRTMNWSWEKIEDKIKEWNRKNRPPLNDNYVNTQLKWFQRQKKSILPPNCDNKLFYLSIGVCKKDRKCEKIKNPVVYPFK